MCMYVREFREHVDLADRLRRQRPMCIRGRLLAAQLLVRTPPRAQVSFACVLEASVNFHRFHLISLGFALLSLNLAPPAMIF